MDDDATKYKIREVTKALFEKGGIKAVQDYVRSHMDRWKSETVNIAVIGRSGVGKSTFINAFRNLNDDAPGSASVGVTETTSKVKSYKDPVNPNIQLFDLPGVGTESFPKDTYLEQIKVDQFDTFLLMTDTRFTEADTWLVNELKAIGKPFFFVRTKVWNDVENKNRRVSVRFPVEQILETIRNDCKGKTKIEDAKIFLIDSHCQWNEKLEFSRLRLAIVEDLPGLKKQALLDVYRDFTTFTPILIKKKGEMLRNRTWKAALLSGVAGIVPIPGVSLAVDMGILSKEMLYYAQQLGLGTNGPIKGQTLPEEALRKIRQISGFWSGDLTIATIRSIMASTVVEMAASVVPVISVIIAGVVSIRSTKIVLDNMLGKMIADALRINELIRNELSE